MSGAEERPGLRRTQTRELAMRLGYEISSRVCDAKEVLEDFFDEDYYSTLKSEDALYSGYPNDVQREYINRLVTGIGEHSAELDGYVEKYARGWQAGRISRTALAVIKTAMYEMLYMQDIPTKVAINEAVEIAKHYDEPSVVSFVNGILGTFAREELPE